MDKTPLFELLSTYHSSALLNLLKAAYDGMSFDQRQAVFGNLLKEEPRGEVDGAALMVEVAAFRRESSAGAFFAPFAMNSRNYRHIPDKTKEWFARLGDLLHASSELAAQGDYSRAVACFDCLYELVNAMESGEDIVFAEEIGGWMIPGDERQFIAAYMAALAATTTPAEFTVKALPLIKRDSQQSFSTQAYASASRAADELQRSYLTAEIQRQEIRTGPSIPNET